MSRIEKAMEKAKELRQGANSAPEPVKQAERQNVVIHTPPPVQTVRGTITTTNPYLVNMIDPHSPTAEEFRKLKLTVKKLSQGDSFKNTIMITSSLPQEGKSITAMNLAISLAEEFDHTVLLVDADMRRPTVNRYLNISQNNGLSECLMGEADVGDVMINTGIGRLSVITAGRSIANPVEFFTSKKMHNLINELKHRYHDRYLIIDTPPVLPFAETRSLGQMVDGVIFVVKERLATARNILDAIDALKGCEMLGMVYNDTSTSVLDDHYSKYMNIFADEQ